MPSKSKKAPTRKSAVQHEQTSDTPQYTNHAYAARNRVTGRFVSGAHPSATLGWEEDGYSLESVLREKMAMVTAAPSATQAMTPEIRALQERVQELEARQASDTAERTITNLRAILRTTEQKLKDAQQHNTLAQLVKATVAEVATAFPPPPVVYKPRLRVPKHEQEAVLLACCLDERSYVCTADGWQTIRSIVEKRYDGLVLSQSDNGLVWEKIINWYANPRAGRKLRRLELTHGGMAGGPGQRGRGVVLTDDHTVLTKRGWIRSDHLTSADYVATGELVPSQNQRAVLLGGMLGDAGIHKRFIYRVVQKAGEQIQVKARYLRDLVAWEGLDSQKNYPSFKLRASNWSRQWHRDWYDHNGTKRLPLEYLEELDARALAVWYMDDGSTQKPFYSAGYIYTDGFTITEVHNLVQAVQRLGIECKVYPCKSSSKKDIARIHITARGIRSLGEIIGPYVVPEMRYKLRADAAPYNPILWEPESSVPGWDTCEIKDVPYSHSLPRTVYCIDVANTHNFVTSGGVVHNCLHMGEVVSVEETNGFGGYNVAIAQARLQRIVEGAIDILTQHHAGEHIRRLWIVNLGDNVSGTIHDSLLITNEQPIVTQVLTAAYAWALAARDFCLQFEEVVMVGLVGNHGRTTRKPATKEKAEDSFDRMVYETVGVLCGNLRNFRMIIPQAYWHYMEINTIPFLFMHGDGIKSWNQIPFYGLYRANSNFLALHATRREFFNYLGIGHHHQLAMMPRTGGEILMTGTLMGGNEFSFSVLQQGCEPEWLLFGVHDQRGVSFRYPINVRDATPATHPRYQFALGEITLRDMAKQVGLL